MKATKILASSLLAGSLLISFSSQAEAAKITQKYEATQFGSHAFWFHGLAQKGLASHTNFLFQEPGKFIEYDDGTATLTGTIYNKKNADEIWEVDLKFELVENWSGGLKNPTNKTGVSDQYAYDNWNFYEFAAGSQFIGKGVYEGSSLNPFNRAFGESNYADFQASGKDPKVVGQLGIGANDKNGQLGFSTWYGYTGNVNYDKNLDGVVDKSQSYTATTHKNWTKSDININLKAVPEPASMLGLLAIGAVGAGAAVKRKKETV